MSATKLETYRIPGSLAEQFTEISKTIHINKTVIIQEFIESFCKKILNSEVFKNKLTQVTN